MWNYALQVLSSIHHCHHFNFSNTDNHNSPWNNSNKKGSRTTAITTVFDIPEILTEIFSYLDEPALRRSAVLVCRDWYLTSLPRLSPREVVWDDTRTSSNNKEVDRVLARLSGAFGLCWYSTPDRKGGVEAREPWQRLVGAVRKDYEQRRQRQKRDRHRHRGLGGGGEGGLVFQNLQRLELGGSIDLGLATRTLLPLLPSLTILELHTHARCSVSMGAVLLACPFLEQVHVSSLSVGAVEVRWPWIPFGHVNGNNSKDKERTYSSKDRGKDDESLQQRHPSSLPLRLVVLENTSVELSGLESLLSLTPDLQELKLIQLSIPRTNQQPSREGSPSLAVTNIATFFPRLKEILQRHGITLNSFHYSLDNEPLLPTPAAAARLDEIRKEICHPRANKWSFWTSADLPPFAYQTLVQIPNVVTTLELHSSKIGRCLMTGCKLHQYLCESPHLLHLKAPRTAFLVDHFDIHGLVNATIAAYEAGIEIGTGTGAGAGAGHGITVVTTIIPSTSALVPVPTTTSTTSTSPSPIWKCRNLRTLHIAFRCNSQTQSTYYPSTLKLLHLRTRILFGYISHVLPDLRDLRMDTSFLDSAQFNVHEAKMYLAFEGGFCLLSRLHSLERISVDAVGKRVGYEPWELGWMLGGGEEDVEGGWIERRRVVRKLEERETRSMMESSRSDSLDVVRAPPKYLSCTACGAKTGRLRPTTNPDSSEVDYDDAQDVRMALANLGCVQDVVDVMDELHALAGEGEGEGEVARCWPHLQKITLYRPNRYGVTRREEAIQQLVHDTFFRTLVRKTFY